MSSCWQVSFFPEIMNDNFEFFLEDFFEGSSQNYNDDGCDEYIGYLSGNFSEQQMVEAAKKYTVVLPE